MNNWFTNGVVIFGILVSVPGIIGLLMPNPYEVTAVVHMDAPQSEVWNVLTDYGSTASWWPNDITSLIGV